jgi:outer membrane protein TolC
MKKMIINFCLIAFTTTAIAQDDQLKLSLEQALKIAIENNRMVKKAKIYERIAKAEYKQSKAVFLPSIEFSMTGIRTNDPLSGFGFRLKQEIVTQADFAPVLLNNPLYIDNFSIKLEMKLPIINMDGYYTHKAAKLNARVSSYMTARSIQQIQFEVKKAYYSLELSNEVVSVIEESLKMAKSAFKVTNDNLEQGYVKEADVLMAKVRVADIQAKLIEAKNTKQNVEEYFIFVLGLDSNTSILTTDRLNRSPSLFVETNTFLGNRSDMLAYKIGIEVRKQMLSAQKMKFLPQINTFGSTEWNDHKFLGTSAKSYTIGAILSWKLFNGNKIWGGLQKAKAQLESAKVDYFEYLEKNELELNKAKRDVILSYEQIRIGELSRKQAAESYRIIKNRYSQGLEKTTDLLYAENLASNRKLEYLRNLYKYQIAIFYVELLLEKNL